MQNIKFTDLLGSDFKESNYAVTSNWRIDFSNSPEFRKLLGGDSDVLKQMSFAFHADINLGASITYARAAIKGLPIRQAAWQEREIQNVPCEVYELMNHQLYKALAKASNKIAGFYKHRNIAPKENYTFSGVFLYALGNSDKEGDIQPECSYELLGAQLNDFTSPTYTSEAANIADVKFNLYAHGFRVQGEDD